MEQRYFRDIVSLAHWLEPGDNTISLVLAEPKRQCALAGKMHDGDILLSFIKGVCCWSGISRVRTNRAKGHSKPLNPVESNNPQDCYYGMALDVEPVVFLTTCEQCFYTRNAVLGLKYQGQGIYTEMRRLEDCERIVDAIKKAEKQSLGDQEVPELEKFHDKWNHTLAVDPYMTSIAVKRSGGKCEICGTTVSEWVDKMKASQPGKDYQSNIFNDYGYAFLEGHHCPPISQGGDARNLQALCPNCHTVISRNWDAQQKKDRKQAK